MKKDILNRSQTELLVLLQYDLWFEVEPEAQYFWFPDMDIETFENWWINLESVYDHCWSVQGLPGEKIHADTIELKDYHDGISFGYHSVLLGTGDCDTFLFSPDRGILYHAGYTGPIHGTPYMAHEVN